MASESLLPAGAGESGAQSRVSGTLAQSALPEKTPAAAPAAKAITGRAGRPCRPRECRPSQAEDVAHPVPPHRLVGQPQSSADGAAGEAVAALGAVAELEALADAGEDHGVVTDDVAAAQGDDADLLVGALADDALAGQADAALEVAAEAGGNGAAKGEGGAARGIDLEPMVDLDDLGIEGVAQRRGGALDEGEEDVDADAHVGGDDAAGARRQLVE